MRHQHKDSLHMDGATRLATLSIPHLDLVLDEIFNIPPPWLHPSRPDTVAEVAAASGEDLAAVLGRMRTIMRMSEGIEITASDLQALLTAAAAGETADPVLLDVREEWEFAICHLAGSILLTNIDLAELLPKLRAASRVVTICHHGVRSYSAAMALRQRGVKGAVSLSGGIDSWALEQAPAMARY